MLLWHAAVSPNGVSGFPDKGFLTARAAQLHSLTTHHDQTRIYPDLSFRCQGHITGITLLGQDNGSPALMGPGVYLQLWQPLSLPAEAPSDLTSQPPPPPPDDDDACMKYYGLVFEEAIDKRRRAIAHETKIVNIKKYEVDLSSSPVDVMDGWVLGIRQTEGYVSLSYQEGGGPLPYSNDSCTVPLSDYDYPLIAVKFTSSGK